MESTTKPRNMEAVRIYLDGGDVKAYLKKCGSAAPDKLWYYIKKQLKKTDPETWEKINGRPKPKKTAPEKPEVKITGPIKYDDFTVQAVKGDYGRYSRSSCSGTEYIDFTSNNGEELTMPISAWRDFLDELHRAAKVLGVDL